MRKARLVVVDGREYLVNGCTCVPDGDWESACDSHDVRYSIGGGFWARARADLLLWRDIWRIGIGKGFPRNTTHFFIGFGYFCGVRSLGWWFWCYWWGCSEREQSPRTQPVDLGPAE